MDEEKTPNVETLLLTMALIGLLMLAMAVGVIVGGKSLRGSCGGVGNACPCDLAGRPRGCETPSEEMPDAEEQAA